MAALQPEHRNLLVRIAALSYIGLLAMMTAACGLALAFGSYRLSMFLFVGVAVLLILAKLLTIAIR